MPVVAIDTTERLKVEKIYDDLRREYEKFSEVGKAVFCLELLRGFRDDFKQAADTLQKHGTPGVL